MLEKNIFTPELTADGSFTFFSSEFGETFHTRYGAKQEAQTTFVKPCQLVKKAQTAATLQIIDICYGLGYNTAAALEAIWSVNPGCRVEWYGLEADPTVFRSAIAHQLLDSWHQPVPQTLQRLAETHQIQEGQLEGRLLIGDARITLQQVRDSGFQADAIFLDPFSPPKCPQLWTIEFVSLVAQCLKPTGRIATYSSAASFRTALSLAGLTFGPTVCVGRQAPGTVAGFLPDGILPLSQQEQEHLETRAAVPYRDPHLNGSAETLRQRRQVEQQSSSLESTHQWRKRWFGNR